MEEENEEVVNDFYEFVSDAFTEDGVFEPGVMYIDHDGESEFMPIGSFMGDKNFLYALVSDLRVTSPVVCFVSEAVVSDSEDGVFTSPPSENPDASEVMLVTEYRGSDVRMFQANILRSGDLIELGDWELVSTGDEMSGWMAMAPPGWN